MAPLRQTFGRAPAYLQRIGFGAMARLTDGPIGRRAAAALETRLLAKMLQRTSTPSRDGRALGSLFARHEPNRRPAQIYDDVFSAQRQAEGYRSQMGQDYFLNRWYFRNRRPGFFVDVGAFDGETGSNTYFFEKTLGWKGLAFEPNPPAYAALQKVRSCQAVQACAYERDGEVSFLALADHDQQRKTGRARRPRNLSSMVLDPSHGAVMLSGIHEHIDNLPRVERMSEIWNLEQTLVTVPCFRIDTLLRQAGVDTVDYLSIDVEGAELQVLQGIDFGQVRVNVIGVERSQRFPEVYDRLTAANFEYQGLLFFDEIFVNRQPVYTWER